MLKLLPKSLIPTSAFRVLGFFAGQTQAPFSFSSSNSSTFDFKSKKDTLYYRLLPVWDPSASVIPILDQWVTEGKPVEQNDLRRIVKQFRKYRRHKHALQIYEWTEDMKLLNVTPGDIAVHLDLISKVHNVEQAETYFATIPESLKAYQVYGALLNCYAESKNLEKAEGIMQEMRPLGYCSALSCNVMLALYSQMRKHDKIDSLMQEMEQKGIELDKYSFSIRLNAYATASDIEGMEKLLMKMEINPQIVMDWNPYVIAAKGYIKAGHTEKALAVLKKAEQLLKRSKMESGYQTLLTLYATMGEKHDVYRVWGLLKKFGKFQNRSYHCMISSLEKLDDLEGAEKLLQEWESTKAYFDIRIPNKLVTAYCKRGHLDKADLLIKRLIDGGFRPTAFTWGRMAHGYFSCNEKEKAVEMMKKAIIESRPGEKIDFLTLASCLEYLKEFGHTDRAKELIHLVQGHGESSVIEKRLEAYIMGGNLQSEDEVVEEDMPCTHADC